MNVDEALVRLRGRRVPAPAEFRRLTDLVGVVFSDFPVTALVTDAMAAARAVALLCYFLARRAEIGLTPILVEHDAWRYLRAYKERWAWPKRGQVRGDLAEIEALDARQRSRRFTSTDVAPVKAALDAIERHLGGPLDARTELLDWAAMQRIEAVELSDDPVLEPPPALESRKVASAGPDTSGPNDRLLELLHLLQQAPPGLPAATPDALFDALAAGDKRHVLLFDCPSYLALYFLGFGSWNDCPPPIHHAAVWRGWNARHGAEVVQVGHDEIVGLVARPATTRAKVARLAAETIAYSSDNLAEGMASLIATLFRSYSFASWWD